MFQCCQLGYVSNGMGAHCVGLSAVEVTAAMDGIGLAPSRRKAMLRDVIWMGVAAADWLNEQSRKANATAR